MSQFGAAFLAPYVMPAKMAKWGMPAPPAGDAPTHVMTERLAESISALAGSQQTLLDAHRSMHLKYSLIVQHSSFTH